jgi:hypothetical protein
MADLTIEHPGCPNPDCEAHGVPVTLVVSEDTVAIYCAGCGYPGPPLYVRPDHAAQAPQFVPPAPPPPGGYPVPEEG